MTTKTTKLVPIALPRLFINTLNEVSVGLKRVSEQLESQSSYMRDRDDPIDGADEIGLWAGVLEGLQTKLDGVMERLTPESRAEETARILDRPTEA